MSRIKKAISDTHWSLPPYWTASAMNYLRGKQPALLPFVISAPSAPLTPTLYSRPGPLKMGGSETTDTAFSRPFNGLHRGSTKIAPASSPPPGRKCTVPGRLYLGAVGIATKATIGWSLRMIMLRS
ncbi:hypothetical protein V8E53_014861 [Lactarius tabidus]